MAILSSYSTSDSRAKALAAASNAPSSTFTPVPFKLLQIKVRFGDEVCITAGAYAGVPFDPWKKGDLVVIVWGEPETWTIGRRASTPAAARLKLETGGPVFALTSNTVLYRIAYRYLQAASRLVGQPFTSQEQLEAALGML